MYVHEWTNINSTLRRLDGLVRRLLLLLVEPPGVGVRGEGQVDLHLLEFWFVVVESFREGLCQLCCVGRWVNDFDGVVVMLCYVVVCRCLKKE